MPNKAVFKALSGCAGGGARSGGIAFLSGLRGRERGDFANPDRLRFVSFATALKLHDKFIQEYGSVVCREMHSKLFGRPFFLPDSDEIEKSDEAGGHTPLFAEVCGKAARWAAEIDIDEGLISGAHLQAIAERYTTAGQSGPVAGIPRFEGVVSAPGFVPRRSTSGQAGIIVERYYWRQTPARRDAE